MNQVRFDMLDKFLSNYYTWDGLGLISLKTGQYIVPRTSSSRRHPYVTLCSKYVSDKPQKYPVHEIVGYYKFGKALIGMTIDHRNNDPTDWSWDNLQLMTLRDNAKKLDNSYIRLTPKQVAEIRTLLDEGLTQQEIADRYGVKRPLISKIKLGNRWKEVII
jgi:hypothetical protein